MNPTSYAGLYDAYWLSTDSECPYCVRLAQTIGQQQPTAPPTRSREGGDGNPAGEQVGGMRAVALVVSLYLVLAAAVVTLA
ncbi:hypothetical protein [Streptomyces sp. NPDC054887]